MFECKRNGAIDVISGPLPISSENVSSFEQTVQACFGNGQPRVVVDLRQTPLMDSMGIEALLNLKDRCQRQGGSMALARPNPLCKDILRVNRLERELSVYDDLVLALGSFSR